MQQHKEIKLPDDEAELIQLMNDENQRKNTGKQPIFRVCANTDIILNPNHPNYFINMMMYSNL